MKKWYVLYVNVRHEKKVMERLTQAGLEAYVPLVSRVRQWSDRRKKIEEPLFTGYAFVKLLSQEFDKPRYIPGVINYLSFEGKPSVVTDREIDALKFFVTHGYDLECEETEFLPGDKAILNLGQFRNLPAEIDQIIGKGYAYVSFDGMKKNIRIKAPIGALKPARK
ncbi:MAG: UpxY family transcription antiterminator [Bacteroidia bacterium]|nr:UpxY family transcription antiterminator [Bacteroidia bacterium]